MRLAAPWPTAPSLSLLLPLSLSPESLLLLLLLQSLLSLLLSLLSFANSLEGDAARWEGDGIRGEEATRNDRAEADAGSLATRPAPGVVAAAAPAAAAPLTPAPVATA
jgi:hypothetical protein